eukprot:TRINITY_DN3444_c0_g1_i1.p1 TRINITY_DN3444_c0_g1~~TRINITY_DN3444_c0_g1_i1.p1  ORF type:complete len:413 (-),score=112.01 TRINITY_DN3444_c0_g1_i1:9-1247(-)
MADASNTNTAPADTTEKPQLTLTHLNKDLIEDDKKIVEVKDAEEKNKEAEEEIKKKWVYNNPDVDSDEDSWESDHPLLMNKLPKGVDKNSAIQGLQTLLYDATPDELADNFKEQGNACLQRGPKYYKDAAEYYTKAIDQKIQDAVKNSILYANRAQANLLLKNYGKTIEDAKKAIELNPKNVKAYYRAAKAYSALGKHTESAEMCDQGLKEEPTNKALQDELKMAKDLLDAQKLRDEAKEREIREQEAKRYELHSALKQRKIVMGPFLSAASQHSYMEHSPVYLDDEKKMHWPVLFFYEEHGASDFIKDFCEDDTFGMHLERMFPADQRCDWDTEKKYVHANLEIYFVANHVTPYKEKAKRDKRKRKIRVKHTTTLKKVLTHHEYVVPGFPVFWIVVADSPYKEQYLKSEIK